MRLAQGHNPVTPVMLELFLRVTQLKVMSCPDFSENDEIFKDLIQAVGLPN